MDDSSLNTAGQVIDELGGTTATATLTGKRAQNVSNWRASGRLPPDTFLVMQDALSARGKRAPAALWGIREPERAA